MATYTVQTPLQHNGKDRKVGARIELDADDAAPLLAVRCIAAASSDEADVSDSAAATKAKAKAKQA